MEFFCYFKLTHPQPLHHKSPLQSGSFAKIAHRAIFKRSAPREGSRRDPPPTPQGGEPEKVFPCPLQKGDFIWCIPAALTGSGYW